MKTTALTSDAQARVQQTLLQALGRFPAPLLPRNEIALWIANLPFREIQLADEACEQFVQDLCWPDLPASVAAQIHVRLESALALCRAGALDMISRMPEEEAIETLLVEFWHRKGIEWTRAVYEGCAAGSGQNFG